MRWITLVIQITALFINATMGLAANEAAFKVNWGYSGDIGPNKWSRLDRNFIICGKGRSQSPIDIPKTFLPANNILTIHYRVAPLAMMNDGPTTLQIGDQQTVINDGHTIQANFYSNSEETIKLDNNHFELVEFHIHSPSENHLEGKTYPLEIHFVHQGEDGTLVVLGVFVKLGKVNNEFEKILEHIPTEKGKEIEITDERINPGLLLPENLYFYRFMGSLTTPPCSEGVQWLVMSQPIQISAKQYARLKRSLPEDNARPTQKLNGRQITFIAK